MTHFLNHKACELVDSVMDWVVSNYKEEELLCNVLGAKGYAREEKEICELANRTKLRLYAEGEGSWYENEDEFEDNAPLEMTKRSEIRQYISEHYNDMVEDDHEDLKMLLHDGRSIVIDRLLKEYDFSGGESIDEVRDAFLRSDDTRVRVAMVYEGFGEYLLEDQAEEVQNAIREFRGEMQ